MNVRALTLFTLFFTVIPVCFGGDGRIHRAAEPVPGLYLVMLNDTSPSAVPNAASRLTTEFGGHVGFIFQHASTGFSVQMQPAQAAALSKNPQVAFVEEVGLAHISGEQSLPVDDSLWHLDRIDQGSLPLNHKYDYCERGSDVYVYMIGSGVWRDHAEFQTLGTSRVLPGAHFTTDTCLAPGDSVDYGYWPCGAGTSDPLFTGHDTAAASALAGNTYGVAKGAKIVPLRVLATGLLELYGQTDWICWAIDWIMTPYNPNTGLGNPYYSHHPALVSMSTFVLTQRCDGEPITDTMYMENEINALVGHPYNVQTGCTTPGQNQWPGIPMVVSANNQDSSQSFTSPARMAFANAGNYAACGHVISVGGTDQNDNRWVCDPGAEQCPGYRTTCYSSQTNPPIGSNYGYTVDLWAPARHLTLAGVQNTTKAIVVSGTSFSAPIVAGVLARMQESPYLNQLSCDAARTQLYLSDTHLFTPIDPVTGNNELIYRAGQQSCYPEYP